MATGIIQRLGVTLFARTDKFNKGVNKSRRQVRGLSMSLRSVTTAVAGVSSVLAGLSFGRNIKDAINIGDEIQKLSLRLGVSTDALSQYRHVMTLAGVDFKTFEKALQNQQRVISEASDGVGVASDSLKELGLSARGLNELTGDLQFEILADSLSQVENSSDRVRIAMDLFGARGVQVLQAMSEGAEGLRKYREEADDLGLTINKLEADRMAELNDSFARLRGRMQGVFFEIANELGPSIIDLSLALQKNLPDAIKFASEGILAMKLVTHDLTATFLRFIKTIEKFNPFTKLDLGFFEGIDKEIELLERRYEDLIADLNNPPESERGNLFTKLNFEDMNVSAVTQSLREASTLGAEIGDVLGRSAERAIVDFEKLSDVIRSLSRDIAQLVIRQAFTEPISNSIGKFLTGSVGGIFAKGIGGTATGGVGADSPGIRFPGVERFFGSSAGAAGVGGVQVNMNVQTSDAGSFGRARSQIMGDLRRGVTRATA